MKKSANPGRFAYRAKHAAHASAIAESKASLISLRLAVVSSAVGNGEEHPAAQLTETGGNLGTRSRNRVLCADTGVNPRTKTVMWSATSRILQNPKGCGTRKFKVKGWPTHLRPETGGGLRAQPLKDRSTAGRTAARVGEAFLLAVARL